MTIEDRRLIVPLLIEIYGSERFLDDFSLEQAIEKAIPIVASLKSELKNIQEDNKSHAYLRTAD
jgi:hypothetical protein